MLEQNYTKQYEVDVKSTVKYLVSESKPENKHHVFAYTITISNLGQIGAKLLRRHWYITDANGQIVEVKGEGVVGEQPYLRPGEAYCYTSYAVLETPVGSMHGSYQLIADDGKQFDAPIAPFSLSTREILH